MKKTIFFLLAAAAVASSCSLQESLSVENANSNEIVFLPGGDLEALVDTKATSAVTSLSSFNVHCVTGTLGTSESSVFNVQFSGSSSYSGGQYWPSTDPKYKFYASNATITPGATGPSISAANTTDIVCAVLESPTYKTSNVLEFSHIFARIGKCKITVPSGYSVSSLSVKITPKTSGSYNMFAGKGKTDGTGWSSTVNGSATTIASAAGSETDNGLYLIPGSYVITASYTLSTGAYSESFTKTATVSIVGGKINNISATLPSGNAADITFTVSIANWTGNDINATLS